MSTAVIPFNFAAPAVALAKKRESSLNSALMVGTAAAYPVLSIKGKMFTLVKDDTRKPLTRSVTNEDGSIEQMPVTSLPLAIVHGNAKSRVFYLKGYSDGDSDGQSPTCYSHDGVAPDASADTPQAKKCQICPHAAWGSKVRNDGGEAKGTACAPRTRLAVADPNNPAAPFLLNLPPASRSNLSNAVKLIESHGKDFNEVAFRVSFDMEAPTPKLVFTPYGMLNDDALVKIRALRDDPVVAEIIGVANPRPDDAPAPAAAAPAAAPAPAVKPKATVVADDEIESALAGTPLAEPVKAKPKAEPAKPKAEPVKAKPAAPVTLDADAAGLLSSLGDLLGSTDD